MVPDEPPVDDSGLGELPSTDTGSYETAKKEEGYVTAPLLSHVRSRLIHGLTLELSFHLAVKARLRLIAKRHGQVVASTPTTTLRAGNRPPSAALEPRALADEAEPAEPRPRQASQGLPRGARQQLREHELLRAPEDAERNGPAALKALRLIRRRLRRGGLLLVIPAGIAAVTLVLGSGPAGSSRAATGGVTEVTPQTDASVPARGVVMIRASPLEAPDETWGVGQVRGAATVVRYTSSSGWSLGPALLDATGKPLTGFALDEPEFGKSVLPSPLAGQMTAAGSGVLVGTVPVEASTAKRQVLLVRNPGGSFQETGALPSSGETALQSGEELFGNERAPLIAPLDEGGHAGALVVPVEEHAAGVEKRVLHWNGNEWSSEAIEIPTKSAEGFRVLAIGASSPVNAWLLAQLSSAYPAGSVALFHRHLGGSEPTTWQPVAPSPGAEPGAPLTVPCSGCASRLPFTVSGTGTPPKAQNQILTVTSQGVWIDGVRTDVKASTTMFFKIEEEGEHVAGHVLGAWCLIPAGHLRAPRVRTESARSAAVRSIAKRRLGEYLDGVRRTGDHGLSRRRQPALGRKHLRAGACTRRGSGQHLRCRLLKPARGLARAVAPARAPDARSRSEPARTVAGVVQARPAGGGPAAGGSRGSDLERSGRGGRRRRGRPLQAREGWLPESLLGASGIPAKPRLRAVAWPRSSRVYAVGDEGEMWLWRGETGLWEEDPAKPVNFRGDLLGIAFDPNEPARGYAVGESGVLLSYGKTWTQEPEAALPPPARGASFTSIAFAGSEAIVAFRRLVNPSVNSYVGGLLVNDGSGWQIDQGAAAAMGADVPWAVAGLPDGGAAFSVAGSGEGAEIFEREGAGAAWQQTPEPFPGGGEPGFLTLFRESGSLRVIAAGSQPNTYEVEREPSPPPGFPPTLVRPYSLPSNPERGLLRQTATGWSDEEHELNNAQEPPGNYSSYDTVYQPDPVAAVLISPEGGHGWAVGGFVSPKPVLDTADIDRYPAERSTPPGVGAAPIGAGSGTAVFAVAGGAQCAAPCADRAKAGIGRTSGCPPPWRGPARSPGYAPSSTRGRA